MAKKKEKTERELAVEKMEAAAAKFAGAIKSFADAVKAADADPDNLSLETKAQGLEVGLIGAEKAAHDAAIAVQSIDNVVRAEKNDAARRKVKRQIVRMLAGYSGPSPVSLLGRTLARGATNEHDPQQATKPCGFFLIEISDHDARQLKRSGLEVTPPSK